MPRALLFVLMMMLSFQSVWTAAASACMHEQTSVSAHFGHHEQHHDEVVSEAASDNASSDLSNSDHHHFLVVSPLPYVPFPALFAVDGESLVIRGVDPYLSISLATLERPPRTLVEFHSTRLG